MDTKQDDLLLLARILDDAGLAWALIGGLAYQIHAVEPRTTLDIDVALADRRAIPVQALSAAGFVRTGDFPYTESWRAPGGAPVQFSHDPSFVEALRTAQVIAQGGQALRVIDTLHFIRAKLRAAVAPQRRRSKALRDLIDVETLLEENPALRGELGDDDRARLDGARARVSRPDRAAPGRD